MDSFGDSSLDLLDLDYSFINDNTSDDFSWLLNSSAGAENYFSATDVVPQEQECTTKECERKSFVPECAARGVVSKEQQSAAKECARKRGRSESCCRTGTKACREKLRRETMNDRFIELSSVLEPGRPAKTDKLVLLSDATRVLNQLRTEAEELKEANEKLQEEINNLKAEKNEIREEKSMLKAEKERMEQHLKAMTPAAFMPAHPASYYAGANKMPVFPYGLIPMWHYLPPSSVDTSHDHELRPPAA